MYIAMLMIVPIIIGIIGLILSHTKNGKGNLSLKEFFAMEFVCLSFVGMGYAFALWTSTYDVEIVSGKVLSKDQVPVSCSHSYSCNCTTDRKGNRSCDTCYEHSWDYDWMVYTDAMNRSFEIDRIDRQGLLKPPRWSVVQVGHPVALQNTFTNYVKAAPDSILVRRNVTEHKNLPVPEYPNKVHDYHYVHRFMNIGTNDPNTRLFNARLMDLNAKLGPTKQVNVIMVEVNTNNPDYEYNIQEKWLNGKKNDVIIVMGVTAYPKLDWVRVITWSKSETLKIELRDSLMEIGQIDNVDKIMDVIYQHTFHDFVRRDFEEFHYLMASVQPGTGMTIFLFLFGLAICIGLYIYFWNNDPFEDHHYNTYRRWR